MNHYLSVLIDSAWTASIVPFSNEATFYAMESFGGFNMMLAVGLAIAGATTGQMFNWWLGRQILAAKIRGASIIGDNAYSRAQKIFNTYLFFLLLLSFLPLFKFLVLAAGFLQTRLRFALPLIIAGYILHYGLAIAL